MERMTPRKILEQLAEELKGKRELCAHLTNTRTKTDIKRMRVEQELINKEAEKMLRIASAKDENGKSLYANEAARKAELTAQLAASEDFVKGLKIVERLKTRAARLKMDEEMIWANIQNLATLEKMYLIDMEKSIL